MGCEYYGHKDVGFFWKNKIDVCKNMGMLGKLDATTYKIKEGNYNLETMGFILPKGYCKNCDLKDSS